MASKLLPILAFAGLQAVRSWDFDGCTSILVSSGATKDGSAIASHSNDCVDCDWRVAYVPAQDHKNGSLRTVYSASWDQYPRLVDESRSEIYHAAAGINKTEILGYIPEVEHTYALWEASYSLMNEHGLGMGESTCPAYLVGKAVDSGGDALFTIGNLMTIALERCKTARCAIQTMGDLGAKYGFYGEDPGIAGAGEAVTLVDKSGEAWVFHISGGVPAKNGTTTWQGQRGAVWVAQRLPQGHVTVIANTFIIKEIDRTNQFDNFMFHPGIFDLVKEAGYWNGTGVLNWQKSIAPDLATFSYFPGMAPIPMYATLRMWGVYRNAAPSKGYEAVSALDYYPFSVPVDEKISHLDVMNWFRSHYEGTEFDMTLGALAGPWQSPNRVEGGKGPAQVPGQFARATSIMRTSYTVLLQTGPPYLQPVVWYAPDASASSVFVPFFCEVLAHADGKYDVEAYGSGSMKSFSFGSGNIQPAWWAHDFVANWLELSYKNMSEQYVYPRVQELQAEVDGRVREAIRAAALFPLSSTGLQNKTGAAGVLADAQTRLQRHVTEQWWSLAEKLVVRYNDGFFLFPEHAPIAVGAIGYPAFWLEMVGYNQQCYKPSWMQPATTVPTLLPGPERLLALQSQSSQMAELLDVPAVTESFSTLQLIAAVVCTAILNALGGILIGYRWGNRAEKGDDYLRLA